MLGFSANNCLELVGGVEIKAVLLCLNCAWDQRVEKFVVGSRSKNVVGWLNDEVKVNRIYLC